MEPIKIIYDEKGNTLYIRFSDKEERYCTESDIGKEITHFGLSFINFIPIDFRGIIWQIL